MLIFDTGFTGLYLSDDVEDGRPVSFTCIEVLAELADLLGPADFTGLGGGVGLSLRITALLTRSRLESLLDNEAGSGEVGGGVGLTSGDKGIAFGVSSTDGVGDW